jgi:hypothetical protein
LEASELETARQVLACFVRNPSGADSLEGVARWRLLEEQVQTTLQTTEWALSWLVSQGFLEEAKTPDGGCIYRLNPKRIDEARCFLDQLGPRSGLM